jgi:hypothetical protein
MLTRHRLVPVLACSVLVGAPSFVGCSKGPLSEPIRADSTSGPAASSSTGAASSSTIAASAPSAAASVPPPAWPADAPRPNAACKTHEDCVVLMWDAIVEPDPCCPRRVGFMPATRVYAEWASQYREQHCAGVACGSLPRPGAEPSCCASLGRCVKKKCVMGCEDPTLNAPKVVWHSAQCTMPRPSPPIDLSGW